MNSDDVKEEKEFEKYFYIINYNREFEEELCMMEMDSFFNMKPFKKQFFANKYINPCGKFNRRNIIKY